MTHTMTSPAPTNPDCEPRRVLQALIDAGTDEARRDAATAHQPQAAVGLITSSAMGALLVGLGNRGVVMIHFIRRATDAAEAMAKLRRACDPVLDQGAVKGVDEELRRFMAGDDAALRSRIDLSLVKAPFQRRVLELLLEVGPGAIATYAALAAWAGAPNAARAVGAAMHDNPLPVYVPCHRVVRSDLSLGGYGGGLDLKRKLLEVEGFSFTPAGAVAQDGTVWGNRDTWVFCRPGCRALARTKRTSMLLLRDTARAAQAGMRPCGICLGREA